MSGRIIIRNGIVVTLNDADDVHFGGAVVIDGEPVPVSRSERRTPSDLLSDELDRFGRDRVYEDAARAAR